MEIESVFKSESYIADLEDREPSMSKPFNCKFILLKNEYK